MSATATSDEKEEKCDLQVTRRELSELSPLRNVANNHSAGIGGHQLIISVFIARRAAAS